MSDREYAYSATATKNPFRYALALWRFIRSKTDDDIISEVAIIEIGFARSRFGRRLARWEDTIGSMNEREEAGVVASSETKFGPIVLEELEKLEPGTLGKVFFEHCQNRGIDPNLVDIPLEQDTDWFLKHLFESHDIWHVITGWSNDEIGEVGLAGFYCGQLKSPPFFVFLLSLILLKKVLRKENELDTLIGAFCTGYRSGVAAKSLFGIDWINNWTVPLDELRQRLEVDSAGASEYRQEVLAAAA